VATASNAVYRYDRLSGWERVPVSGWDAGNVMTNPAPAQAIAVGPDGQGVLVGRGGRVADVGPGGVVLDAASVGCFSHPDSCAGGSDLDAAAVRPPSARA
jgi:hypothetical protein